MSDKTTNIDPMTLAYNPRATLRSWQRYEKIVYAAIAHSPQPYIYIPEVLSANTITTRLRDAIRGAIAFSYPSQIPADVLAKWFSTTIFKSLGDSVYIGPAKDLGELSIMGAAKTSDTPFTFPTLDFSEIAAFALLISRGKIPGGVTIKAPPFGLESLPKYPNLEIVKRPDGSIVLL